MSFAGFKSSAKCIKASFTETLARKRQFEKVTIGDLKKEEVQDIIKQHEQEPNEEFEERREELTTQILEALKEGKDKAKYRLELLHSLLKDHLNYNPKRLKSHCITTSFKRDMFERSVMKKIHGVYVEDPDLFGELRPHAGHTCLESIAVPKDLRHYQVICRRIKLCMRII